MMDLQAMCRLCFFKLHEPQNIFDTPGLLDRIVKFTDVKIIKGDGLPNSICDFCELKLQISDKFSRQVSLADKRIRAAAQLDNGLHENNQDNNLDRQNSVYAPWPNSELLSELRIPSQFGDTSKNSHENKSTNTPVLYSYSTARSIVAAYKALISRCVLLGFPEDFTLPTHMVISEKESNSEGEMQATRVAPICRRRNKKKLQRQADDVLPKRTRSVPVTPRCVRTPDPLNLLKVKRIQRLVGSDRTSDDENQTVSSSKDSSDSAEDTTTYTRLRTRTQLGYIKNRNYYESSIDSDTNCSQVSYGSCLTEILQHSKERERQRTKGASVFDFPVSQTIIQDKMAAVANEVPDNVCPVCKKVCANAYGLWIHMCVVHRTDKCAICKVSTASKEDFRTHMYNHHPPFNRSPKIVFRCTICRRICKSKTGLLLHMRHHTKSLPVTEQYASKASRRARNR